MKENDLRLVELNQKLVELYERIKLKPELDIDIQEEILVFTLHKYLKITVVNDSQFDESDIFISSNITTYNHWHLSNDEALKFIEDLIDDKLVFIESKLLGSILRKLTYKIISIDKYELMKSKLLGKKYKKIFTASKIIQGTLKKKF